jgi:hypothetical protein
MNDALWLVISIQMVMGGFDAFYHHELTERLAWRPGPRRRVVPRAALKSGFRFTYPTIDDALGSIVGRPRADCRLAQA